MPGVGAPIKKIDRRRFVESITFLGRLRSSLLLETDSDEELTRNAISSIDGLLTTLVSLSKQKERAEMDANVISSQLEREQSESK